MRMLLIMRSLWSDLYRETPLQWWWLALGSSWRHSWRGGLVDPTSRSLQKKTRRPETQASSYHLNPRISRYHRWYVQIPDTLPACTPALICLLSVPTRRMHSIVLVLLNIIIKKHSSLFIHHLYKSIRHDKPWVLFLVVRTVVDKYYLYVTVTNSVYWYTLQ
jgi:hypothetical protein